jgi:hypothetical protein
MGIRRSHIVPSSSTCPRRLNVARYCSWDSSARVGCAYSGILECEQAFLQCVVMGAFRGDCRARGSAPSEQRVSAHAQPSIQPPRTTHQWAYRPPQDQSTFFLGVTPPRSSRISTMVVSRYVSPYRDRRPKNRSCGPGAHPAGTAALQHIDACRIEAPKSGSDGLYRMSAVASRSP